MKNVKMKLIALMLVFALALTGCATANVGLVIHSDGSVSSTTEVLVQKEQAIKALQAQGYSEAEATNVVNTMAVAYGAKLQKIDGKDCYQIKETNKTEKDEVAYLVDYDYGYVSKDTYYDIEDTEVLEDDTVSMYNIPASAVTMTMTITFPAKVVRTNGTIDPANPNKVSFSIPYNKKTEIFATTNPKNTISSIKAKIKASNTIKKPKIKKLKANKVAKKAKKATVSLKIGKVKGAKKYEVEWSTNKKFKKNCKYKTIKKTSYKITKLKKNTKYYVRVAAMKKNLRGEYVYSKYAKKSVKTKK